MVVKVWEASTSWHLRRDERMREWETTIHLYLTCRLGRKQQIPASLSKNCLSEGPKPQVIMLSYQKLTIGQSCGNREGPLQHKGAGSHDLWALPLLKSHLPQSLPSSHFSCWLPKRGMSLRPWMWLLGSKLLPSSQYKHSVPIALSCSPHVSLACFHSLV